MRRPTGTGSIYKQHGSERWWIKYHRDGQCFRESAETTKISAAKKLLADRLADVSKGTLIEPNQRRVLIDDLYAALVADYRNNELASLQGAEQRWQKRLKPFFGGRKAVTITTALLNRYVATCREQGLANATINRDLAALRRALNLAREAGTLTKVPTFPHLTEAAPRSGFVEEAQYRKLAQGAQELWLRALLATAYTFGLRKGELLNLRVRQVDLLNRTIRLNPGETKSGEGRVIKLTTDVAVLLAACVAGKDGERFVFTRPDGKPVLDFRERWEQLTTDARCPGLLFHDLRRSAVRNMVRRGVPESVAMKISGHKTRDVFERYNITSEADLQDAALKIEAGQKNSGAVWAEFGHSEAENGVHDAPQELPN